MHLKHYKPAFKLFFLFTILLIPLILTFATAGGGAPLGVHATTTPLEAEWLADGSTLYRMDITLDASEFFEGVMGVTWAFQIPHSDQITFSHSEFPEENFFFEGEQLDPQSDPESIVEYDDADRATRITGDASVLYEPGAWTADGILASYWFVVEEEALAGEYEFDLDFMNIVYFNDQFPLECPGGGMNIVCTGWPEEVTNHPFEIVVKPQRPKCPHNSFFTTNTCRCPPTSFAASAC